VKRLSASSDYEELRRDQEVIPHGRSPEKKSKNNPMQRTKN
jgi:hypothetical protein